MYCAKCGTDLPEDAIVFYKCATATAGSAVPQKSRLRSPLVIVAVVIACISLGACFSHSIIFGGG